MHACKLLSCKCFLGLRGLYLRRPVKYVNFQKLYFHIFSKFEYLNMKNLLCAPQFSTEFELKEILFEEKYVLCWNTQSVTLMREAILYCLPKTKLYLH